MSCAQGRTNSTSPAFRSGGSRAVGSESELYVFGVRNPRFRLAARGPISLPQFSPDGRYISCIATGGKKPADMTVNAQFQMGTLRVYAFSNLKQLLPSPNLVTEAKFSPDGNRLAFIELVKDEYGDFADYSLKVANIKSGAVNCVTVNRREPKYMWAGNGRLAVATCDKFAAPSVSLVDLITGKSTRLATNREFAGFEPLAYVPSKSIIVYKAATSVSGEKPEELWAAGPGSVALRLFPKVGGAGYAKP